MHHKSAARAADVGMYVSRIDSLVKSKPGMVFVRMRCPGLCCRGTLWQVRVPCTLARCERERFAASPAFESQARPMDES